MSASTPSDRSPDGDPRRDRRSRSRYPDAGPTPSHAGSGGSRGRADAQRWARDAERLARLSHALTTAPDPQALLRRIADAALHAGRADGVYVEIIDPTTDEVEIADTGGAGAPNVGTRIPYPGSLAERVIQSGQPEIVRDMSGEPIRPVGTYLDQPFHGIVAPLMSEDHPLGALVLLRRPGAPGFRHEDVDHIRTLSDLAALSLRRSILLDESERRRERAESAERLFHLFTDRIREVFYLRDLRSDRIRYISPGYEDVWRRPRAALYEDPYSHLEAVVPEDRARVAEMTQAGAGGEERECEYRIHTPDGETRWVLDRSYPVRDVEGEVVELIGVAEDVTERKRAEAERERLIGELESQHTIIEAVLDQLPVGAAVAEAPSGRMLYFNREAERLLGHPLIETEDYGGYARYGAVHPDGRPFRPEEHPLARATLQGEVVTGERIRYRRPDGRMRLLAVSATPIITADGERIAAVAVFDDVTARTRALHRRSLLAETSARLAASLDYRRTLSEIARIAVPELADYMIVDLVENGEIHRVEAAHREPEKDAAIKEITRRPPQPDRPSGVAQVLRTGKPVLVREVTDAEIDAATQTPEHFDAVQTLNPQSLLIVPLIARGHVLGAITLATSRDSKRRYDEDDVGFAEDLARRAALAIDNALLFARAHEAQGEAERRAREESALREATAALSASFTVEEVLRQIADNALVATNADGAFVERVDLPEGTVEVVAVAGDRTPEIGGGSRYDGSFTQLVLEQNQPVVVGNIGRDDSDRPLPRHLVELCPDCTAAFVPLVNAGEPIGTLVLIRTRDKHGFRPDEIERALTFGDLAALAFRKVHILEESERRREELERISESRARLMRGFSHDVKNPIGAADGLLDLLESGVRGELVPEQRDDVRRARRSLRSALRLIEDLLAYARTEAETIQIETEPTDVREALREIGEEYRAGAEAKQIDFSIDLPHEFPIIGSDPERVRQVLGNLLSNAVKFTPSGGRIDVRATVRHGGDAPGAGAWIAVEIADTGPGIPADDLPRLFEEFTRLRPPGAEPGAGVGLAMGQRIAQALGGRITVESTVDVGSTFTLWLPVRENGPGLRAGDDVAVGAGESAADATEAGPAAPDEAAAGPATAPDGRTAAAAGASTASGWPDVVLDHLDGSAAYMIDEDGRIVRWNAAAERLTGYSADEALGRSYTMLYPDDAGAAEREMRAVLEQGRLETEGWRLRADGGRFYASEIMLPVREEPAREVGFARIVRDISTERRTETALRATEARARSAEQRLRLTLEAAELGDWELDLTTGESPHRSLRHDRIFGYDELVEDWSYDRFKQHVHPDDRELVDRDYRRALERGEPWEFECRIRRTDGALRWIWAKGSVHYDADGRPDRAFGVVMDITEEKRAQAERQELLERERAARRRATTILESITDAFFALDHDRRFTYVNREAERLLRRTREELIGREIWSLFPEAVGSVFQREYERAFRESVTVGFEEYYEPLGLWLDVRAYPSDDGLSVYFRDVTERHRAEQELRAAKQEAEAASRTKSDFLAVMSHELRTPLTAVVGYAEILESGIAGPISERQKEHLRRITMSARHLVDLIEEILTFARLDSGRDEVRLEDVELTALTREMASVVEPSAEQKDLRFRVALPDEPVPARSDPVKVRHILLNLLTNAVSFTHEGEIALRMDVTEDAVVYRVSDTGVGIAREDIERVFEPFWQAAAALTREVGGTGLGLTIARRLTEMLGGEIHVESEIGKGSTFTVRIPREPRTDMAARKPTRTIGRLRRRP